MQIRQITRNYSAGMFDVSLDEIITRNNSLKNKMMKCNPRVRKGLPLPLGRGVCETKSKNGRSTPRKPFISRVFCAQRGSETMVSDPGLGRGQTMDGVGVDPETMKS